MELLLVCLQYLFSALLSFGALCLVILVRTMVFSEKIKSQDQLNALLCCERNKLGLTENIIINAEIRPRNDGGLVSCVVQRDENVCSFEITLVPHEANRCVLKHELYHVYLLSKYPDLGGFMHEFLSIMYEWCELNLEWILKYRAA